MRIEDWSIVSSDLSPYQAPEVAIKRIQGSVFGSKSFDDGAKITTSPLISLECGLAVTKSGSNYILGSVNSDYLNAYPEALELANNYKQGKKK